MDMHEDMLANGPRLVLKGFSDISYSSNLNNDKNTFALGQFDFFVTSELSDKFSFLGELVYKYGKDNKATFDLERVQIKFSYSDQVNVAAGRMHTPLGYWNETYHHGTWFQTTAFRPLMLDRNVLPQHIIGAEFFGFQKFSAMDFEYNFAVANGRGRSTTENQNFQDYDSHKAFNMLLKLAPETIPGLKFGFNTYIDTIPPDPTVVGRNSQVDERILGGDVVYLNNNIEFLSEYANIRHKDTATDISATTTGYYVQGAYQFPHLKPYYRFDYLNFGSPDSFYAPLGPDLKKNTLGVRYDPILWLCLKFEYAYTLPTGLSNYNSFNLQMAFTF